LFSCCSDLDPLFFTVQGNSYFAVPVAIAPYTMLDTAGAGEYAAAKLTQLQYFPCMNATGVSTTPAFCTEFNTPAMCGSPTYAFQADGLNIPQCAAAGSSSVLNVLDPATCEPGVPPVQYANDITAWLSEQMSYVATKHKDIRVTAVQADATQKNEVGVRIHLDGRLSASFGGDEVSSTCRGRCT
jgi:hypothetical protein